MVSAIAGRALPLAQEAAHELGGDVLRVGRAAAVAEEQELPARGQGARHEIDRRLESLGALGEEDVPYPGARLEELLDGRSHGRRRRALSRHDLHGS